MECNKPANIEEVKDEVSAEANAQCDCVRGDRGRRGDSVRRDRVLDTGGADSSLLFFFLLLVVIVCQSDCDIELETLLWFFLLLVALFNFCDCWNIQKNLLDSLSRFHFLFFSLSNNSISSLSKSISSIKSSAYKVTYLNWVNSMSCFFNHTGILTSSLLHISSRHFFLFSSFEILSLLLTVTELIILLFLIFFAQSLYIQLSAYENFGDTIKSLNNSPA